MRIGNIVKAITGERRYLHLRGYVFQKLYPTGRLGKEFQDVYLLKEFIRPGDYCIDIGAHLGYFSLELGRLVKDSGKVFAVEPMRKFNEVLHWLLRRFRIGNVTVYTVALGGNGEFVEMGIPMVGKDKKYGYARIMESATFLHYIESEKVKNESGDALFSDLPRLDYVKCDVEGLEFPVISSMIGVITKYEPILLCEFADNNERIKLYELLRPLGYGIYALQDDGKCHSLDIFGIQKMISQNNYFIPHSRMDVMQHLISGTTIAQ